MCFKSKAPTLNDIDEINQFVHHVQYETGVSFEVISEVTQVCFHY